MLDICKSITFAAILFTITKETTGLQCKRARKAEWANSTEYLDDSCPYRKGVKNRCFFLNCSDGNAAIRSQWGCASDFGDAPFLQCSETAFFNASGLSCKCLLGAIGVGMANKKMSIVLPQAIFRTSTTTTTTSTTTEKPKTGTTIPTTTPKKTSDMTTPSTNVDFGDGRKTGLLCVLDRTCHHLFAKEKNGTAKVSRRFAPHLLKESGKCKKLGDAVRAAKDQIGKLGNELSESIQKVGLVFVDDYILAIE